MATYILIKTPYCEDGCAYFESEALDMMTWFRSHWQAEPVGITQFAYGLGQVFAEASKIIPEDDRQLIKHLEANLYTEGDMEVEDHFLHVNTDDDEVSIEYFIFDTAFLGQADALNRLPSPRSFSPGQENFPEIEADREMEEERGSLEDYTSLLDRHLS